MAERKNKNSLDPWWHLWAMELINLGTALPLDGMWYKIINLIVWSCWVEFAAAKVKKQTVWLDIDISGGTVVLCLRCGDWSEEKSYPGSSFMPPVNTHAHSRCSYTHSGQQQLKNGSNYLNIVTRRTSLGLKSKVQGPSFVQIRDIKHHQVGLGENKPIKLWHLLVSCPWA